MSPKSPTTMPPAAARPEPTEPDGPDPYGDPDPDWLRIDWREHLRAVHVPPACAASRPRSAGPVKRRTTRTTLVNYVDLGPPESERERLTLLFVHGLSGCWQNWLENLPDFARSHRVVALDLPGFGDSPRPPWEISIPAYGVGLAAFCDAIGVGDAAVIGNSMGGFIAAEAVIDEPQRFEKLVLVSAAGVSSARLRRRPTAAVARTMAAGAPVFFALQRRWFRHPRIRDAAFAAIVRHPLELRPELLWELFDGGIRGEGFAKALTELAGYDFIDRLDDVEVPTLIAWGRNDRIVPPSDASEYHRHLRNSEVVVFDDCGHAPMAERPTRFNRLLGEFVAR